MEPGCPRPALRCAHGIRFIPWHKTEAERAIAATDTKIFLESFIGLVQGPHRALGSPLGTAIRPRLGPPGERGLVGPASASQGPSRAGAAGPRARTSPWRGGWTARRALLVCTAGKGKVTMWMDTMDDKLEKLYEARPCAPPPASSRSLGPQRPARSPAPLPRTRARRTPTPLCSGRWYVIDVTTGKMIAATGLAPFNMAGKVKVLEAACA